MSAITLFSRSIRRTTTLYFVSGIVILKMHTSSTRVIKSPIPFASCFDSEESDVIVLAELQIVFFSLYKATESFRNWGRNNRLLEILIQYNIFYFTCGLCSSVVVTIPTTALLQVSASSLLEICVDGTSQAIAS
ncbi:hypothetical protein DFJ58DRAFT_731465 [Suillus subalutaceus]|uniref:uncharacterized protein n=1 Tax=Suillus subalutaceus TaxID=48586 RepID=UPI001B8814D2|nr:uncharacterized protein DFJ58DRAFT_731465 [Suillus subalutaceus]KAG1843795.1 hypothetical protein DFJ58DRAFT_731465 [Suillus subalutaceus]